MSVGGRGSSGQLLLNCLRAELSNLELNERGGETGHIQEWGYADGEQGSVEYEQCPRCWQTRGNRANLLSTLLSYWR